VALTAAPVAAQEAVLEAVDSGSYRWDGSSSPSNTYYPAGDSASSGVAEQRNFFVFDLSGLPAPVLEASLALYNPSDPPDPGDGYRSPDPFETYTLVEVTTDIATLTGGGSGLTWVFDDLGSGTLFGEVNITAADNGTLVRIPLNHDAVTSLNAAAGAGGLWAIGGAVTTLDGTPLQMVFAYANDTMPRRLILDMGGTVFSDGFESSDTTRWTLAIP
jgi:hypothetical protein